MKFTNEQEAQIAEVLEWLQQAGSIKWRKPTPDDAQHVAIGTLEIGLMEPDDDAVILTMDDDHANLAAEGYIGIGVVASQDAFENVLNTVAK